MSLHVARGSEGDPMRLVVSVVVTALLGWWFMAVYAAGEISIRAGPRAAKATFAADRLTDPGQFNGALTLIAVLFLLALAATSSTLWNIVAASVTGREDTV